MTSIQSAIATIQNNIKQEGLPKVAYDLCYRVLNKIVHFMVLECMIADKVNSKLCELPPGYTARFLSIDELRKYVGPACELDETFLQTAFGKGDVCMGILSGEELASYGWYAQRQTVVVPGLMLHFSPEYVYMYKGFTLPAHRGKRLHAIGMTLALRHFLEQESKGLISFVEANNFSSLNSTQRMGYKTFGRIVVFSLLGKYFIRADKECVRRGFEVRAEG